MKSIVEDDFPTGYILTEVSVVEDKEFGGDELCLDQVQLIFQDTKVILRSLADTDEIEIIHKNTTASSPTNTPAWCSQFLGKKLQTVWVCENVQGYRDQIVFAFDRLHPSIAFVAEGAVLKVFRYEQVSRLKTSRTELQHSQV